jgi:hypothetical protein
MMWPAAGFGPHAEKEQTLGLELSWRVGEEMSQEFHVGQLPGKQVQLQVCKGLKDEMVRENEQLDH